MLSKPMRLRLKAQFLPQNELKINALSAKTPILSRKAFELNALSERRMIFILKSILN